MQIVGSPGAQILVALFTIDAGEVPWQTNEMGDFCFQLEIDDMHQGIHIQTTITVAYT
jgi:hypothetical protein